LKPPLERRGEKGKEQMNGLPQLVSPLYPKESCWEIRLGVNALYSTSFASLATRALNSALRRLLFRLLIWFYFGLVALKNQLFSSTSLWLRFVGPLAYYK
jgi:hypothetical protein